jgi:tetratricopeptide (TPR) repeat protein
MLAEALQGSAYQVTWHGGAASDEPPDLVVLDGDDVGVGRLVEVWRRHDPPPALLLLGATPQAQQAAERRKLPLVPKPIDVKVFLEIAEAAVRLRFVMAFTPAAAACAVKMRPREDPLENASVVIGGARMIDPGPVRVALRSHALDYVTPTPFLVRLREERALNVPEQNLAMRLDGASTLKAIVDSGALEPTAAGRLLWALVSVGAVAFLPDPHPDGQQPRLRATIRARKNLKARRVRGEKALFYDVLEVSPDPDAEEVERACQLLAVWYAPRRMHGLDLGDMAPLVEPTWHQILKARATLAAIDSRIAYERWLLSRGVTLEKRREDWDRGRMDAEEAFLAGQKALGAGEVAKAVSTLAKAARLRPEEPDYEAYAAWARVLSEEQRGADRAAVAARERAVAEEVLLGRKPRPRALVALGLLCEAAGDLLAAREAFEDALDCEPRMALAKRALQRLGVTPSR